MGMPKSTSLRSVVTWTPGKGTDILRQERNSHRVSRTSEDCYIPAAIGSLNAVLAILGASLTVPLQEHGTDAHLPSFGTQQTWCSSLTTQTMFRKIDPTITTTEGLVFAGQAISANARRPTCWHRRPAGHLTKNRRAFDSTFSLLSPYRQARCWLFGR